MTQQELMQEAGIPYLIESKNGTNSLEYRYQLKSDLLSDDSHEKSGAEYILKFTFSKHDALITIAGKIPLLGDIKFDLGDSELDAAVN